MLANLGRCHTAEIFYTAEKTLHTGFESAVYKPVNHGSSMIVAFAPCVAVGVTGRRKPQCNITHDCTADAAGRCVNCRTDCH